jgi:vitamin K-dependent gamma-carboxylase
MTERVAWLRRPLDASALALFRMALGAVVLSSALRFLLNGWADRMFVRPTFRFHYWGFGWLPQLPPAAVQGLFVVLALAGVLVAVGLCYRPAVATLFVVFTLLQLVDVANYLNHYYLVSLLSGLMFFVPAHRLWSLDARRNPRLRSDFAPAWCTYLLRFQVAVVYVNAGLAKATADWLLHAQPLNIWLSARTSLPIVGPLLDLQATAYAAAWAGFLFDTTIAFWLLWRRTRPVAYVAVLGFHVATHFLFPFIGMFPVIMVVAAQIFFEPDWPRRLAARVTRGRWASGPPLPAPALLPGRWFVAGASAAALFALAQVAMPLRTHLYGGNVLWHEQGMRFSWRVMAREKNGSVTFLVRAPGSGREWAVPPSKYLTRTQELEMSVQPDLIQQLAVRIARDFERSGRGPVEVHADARVSLNGRPASLLIDPAVDLSRVSDGLGAKSWILPAPAGPPPRLRSL